MRKILILLALLVLMMSSALAAMSPFQPYCEHQGYTYNFNSETGEKSCIFDDGKKCDAKAFLDGTCGQEYVKEIPCRQKGEIIFPQSEECCAGLNPKSEGFGQATCQELGFFEKVWRWFASLF